MFYSIVRIKWNTQVERSTNCILKKNVYITKFNCYNMHWFSSNFTTKRNAGPFLSNELNIFKSHSLKCQHWIEKARHDIFICIFFQTDSRAWVIHVFLYLRQLHLTQSKDAPAKHIAFPICNRNFEGNPSWKNLHKL